jgi:manganese/zinc/iron transport system permease protein
MHYALMVMVAITTVANFEAVGSILVIAMLIVPGAAAHLLTDKMGMMIVISLLAAVASAVMGHVLAAFGPGWLGFHESANTAAMMSVVAGAILFAAILFAPEQGLLSRAWHRAALSAQIARQDILGLLYRWQEREEGSGRRMRRADVLAAVGGRMLARRELRRLIRAGEIDVARAGDGGERLALTPRGFAHASEIIGSHRLWESYLARHFELAPDHLHAPAERMEHYIDPQLRDELREQLSHPTHDPQGKRIPRE